MYQRKRTKQSDKQMIHVSEWKRKKRTKYVGTLRKREQKTRKYFTLCKNEVGLVEPR